MAKCENWKKVGSVQQGAAAARKSTDHQCQKCGEREKSCYRFIDAPWRGDKRVMIVCEDC